MKSVSEVRSIEYAATELIASALRRYYAVNGIPADGGVSDRWARYRIAGLSLIGFPNFPHRMRAILRHDLHHIVLNLDTSSLGEGLIAAWELGSGCGRYWISWCMEPQALWWGILMAPRKTFALFVLGRNSRNFFHENLEPEISNKTVGEIRTRLLPAKDPILKATVGDCLMFTLSAVLGLAMIAIFTPIFVFFTIFGGLSERFYFPRRM